MYLTLISTQEIQPKSNLNLKIFVQTFLGYVRTSHP